MRTLFVLLSLALSSSAFAETPSSDKWDCIVPDKSMKETVEAPDQKTAEALCREKLKAKFGAKFTESVSDDLFSRRSLLK